MGPIRFNDALRRAALTLQTLKLPQGPCVRLVRDVYGRLRFALDCAVADFPSAALEQLKTAQATWGVYATSIEILSHDSFTNPASVFASPDWHQTLVDLGYDEDGKPRGQQKVWLLDRQINGQDWLRPQQAGQAAPHPHRTVFFGLKGGVGRSTALSLAAWGLARRGKRVLLIDFDLESPGLSGLLQPANKVAEFGVVDWLLEDAVGQGDSVVPRMVSASPLGESTISAIRVVAAVGLDEKNYLAKLARAYADVPSTDGPQRMGQRMLRLVELLEAQEKPDVVLIDSRAGLHDLAAVAITCIADTALMFATDGAQSWNGYRQLFSHWQQRPDVATRVRDRLMLVRALAPKAGREESIRRFHREAYSMFAETLYDEIPASNSTDENAYFHPGEADESAPHFPVLIDWDERFQEFDPMLRPEDGGATDAQIEAAFGHLIRRIAERIEEH